MLNKLATAKYFHCLICFLMVFINCGYIFLKNRPESFPWLCALFLAQGALLGLFFNVPQKRHQPKVPKLMMLTVILLCAAAFFSEPLFEDDYWRYLWDGKVALSGTNPYVHAPDSEALDSLHTDYRKNINYMYIKTIYPPLAQYIFSLSVKVFGETLWGLKLLFILFHLLTGAVIYRWLQLRGISEKWVYTYLLHPMPIKEIANSAHVDSVMVFFMVFAAYLWDRLQLKKLGSEWCSWILLGLSVLVKIIPVVLIPSFLAQSKKPIQGLAILSVVLLALSAPFLSAGSDFVSGIVPFSMHWVSNESLFYPISFVTNKLLLFLGFGSTPSALNFIQEEYPARIIVAFIFSLYVLYRFARVIQSKSYDIAEEALWVITALLLLAPTFNPWYSLWILPFAVIKKSIPLILLPGLTVLSYAIYWKPELALKFQAVEYSLFFVALSITLLRKKHT